MNKRLLQKEKTSQDILKASLHVFAIRGYFAATYNEISKIANVTNGLIVQRFVSKENLYIKLFNKVLLSNLPFINDFDGFDDALLLFIDSIKEIASNGKDDIAFVNNALNSLDNLPKECKTSLQKYLLDSSFEELLKEEIENKRISEKTPFDAFINILKQYVSFTFTLVNNNVALPPIENYLHLFKKWNFKLDSSPLENFNKISTSLVSDAGISSWYAEFEGDNDPKLFLEPRILKKMGIKDDSSPEFVYKFTTSHVSIGDKSVLKTAIERLLAGEIVEFSFHWTSPTTPDMGLRCFGRRVPTSKAIRLEGFLQNLTSVSFVRNRKNIISLIMKSISIDFDYVCYIHIGNTEEDDYIEEYKKSDFIDKIANNWEGKICFTDRINIALDKIVAPVDKEKFLQTMNRAQIVKQIRMNGVYSQKLKVQYLGSFYTYEITFIADHDDNGDLVGAICGIRMFNFHQESDEAQNNLNFILNKEERERKFNSLFAENLEAAYLVNLDNNSFEIFKRSESIVSRNRVVPDFEVYSKTCIENDVFYEDRQLLLQECKTDIIKERLQHQNSYSINYRDCSTGVPLYSKLRFIKAGNNLVAVGVQLIHQERFDEEENKDKLEAMIHEKDLIINEKNNIINSLNKNMSNLIVEVIDSHRENTATHSHKIREITSVLANQLMNDYPEFGLTKEDVYLIAEASNLHDIGKISIPDSILYKTEMLTDEEFEIIKTHSENGIKLIQKVRKYWKNSYYQIVSDVIKYHHERWNGEGYPEGLKGNEIPLSAQIVGLTDVFDALISKRIYKGPYDPDTAYMMIINGECGSFNPKLIESFKHCFKDMTNTIAQPVQEGINHFINNNDQNRFINSLDEHTLPALAQFTEQMPGGFFLYRKDDGQLLFFNDLMVKYFKCDNREDFIRHVNNSFKGIVHPDDFDEVNSQIESQLKDSPDSLDHVRYRIICKDGEEKYVDDYGHLVHSEKYGDVLYVFLLDVTANEIVKQGTTNLQRTKPKKVSSNPSQFKLLEGVRVLLVDDNDLSRFMTKDVIEEQGAIVSDFSNGYTALEEIKKVKPFDIILTDLVMPDMNGAEFAREVRQFEEGKDIRSPIVAITGEKTSELATEALNNGADGCMGKPISPAELARLLILSMKEHSTFIQRKLEKTLYTANIDALTHVKNISSYQDKIVQLTRTLEKNPYHQFGVIIADINQLKQENDTYGHDVGDIYIKNCSQLICNSFAHSPVYRIGGDEFAVILEDSDYKDAEVLFNKFLETVKASSKILYSKDGKASIAAGLAIYNREEDKTIQDVVKRADKLMYINKREQRNKETY